MYTPPRVSVSEMMAEVESLRMGYWYLAMQRGEVHDAHQTLRYGLLVLEMLREQRDYQHDRLKPESCMPGGGCLPDLCYLLVLAIKATAAKVDKDLGGNRYYQRALRLHRQLCSLYSSRRPADDVAFG